MEKRLRDSVTIDGVEYEAECVANVDEAGQQYVTDSELRRWERSIADLLIREGARGPEAVRWLRKQARLKQDELGELLGHNRNTVRRWESGEVPVPVAPWMALAALVESRKHAEERLKAALNPPAPGRKFVA